MERLNAWNTYDLAMQNDCMDFAKDYMEFLNAGKTERECVDFFVAEAEKKGYIEPNTFVDLFCKDDRVLTPEVIYIGKLDMDFVNSIVKNDWTKEGCQYPNIKEGVVIKRSTLMKGQRLPMCKVKTIWWLEQLHSRFPKEMWDKLE